MQECCSYFEDDLREKMSPTNGVQIQWTLSLKVTAIKAAAAAAYAALKRATRNHIRDFGTSYFQVFPLTRQSLASLFLDISLAKPSNEMTRFLSRQKNSLVSKQLRCVTELQREKAPAWLCMFLVGRAFTVPDRCSEFCTS